MIRRVILAAALLAGSVAAAGCSLPAVSSSASPTPAVSASSKPSPQTIPTPSGFPADVPVYPGAHLISGAAFNSTGQVAWGLTWQTVDTPDKVQAFYLAKLKQGDWTISFSGTANGSFSAVFSRHSDSKVNGVLGVAASSGVTTISMSLVGGQ